jgi:putative membrane protein
MSNSIGRFILAGATWAALCGITFAQSTAPAGTPVSPNGLRTSPETQPSNRTAASNPQQNSDLIKAIEANVAEVYMGKMAETRAQNAKVKAFAQKMVEDHSAALTKLKALPGAPTSEVKPNDEHQKAADMTAKMTGASFDRDFIDMMVKDHEEAVDFLEQQTLKDTDPSSTSNNTLPGVARELLPTVREHLRDAQNLQKEVGNGATTTPPKR